MRALICLLVITAAVLGQEWPFGGQRMAMRGGDYYNLGLIGAKAADASKPAPAENAPPRSGRRSVQMSRPTHDDGPDGLRITLLFPDGPAAKAGLAKGDIIVGVGSRKFSAGSLAPIAKALLKAEAGKGELTLWVRKGGQGKAAKVKVVIGTGTKAAAKPTVGAGRDALVERALAWLAKRQREDGGYLDTLSGKNGAVVQVALAGMAWIGAGSDLKQGPYKDNLRRAADWAVKNVKSLGGLTPGRGGKNWNQSNWALAYGAIFLGELHAHSADETVRDGLHHCARKLVENQEKTGGWAHGPGGPNALDYVELNIVTGLALCGLGLAGQSGFVVPPDCFDRADAYLKESGSGDGGVAYSHQPGQRGQGNIGRTAGAWLGYLALGKGKTARAKKMGGYVRRHADKVLGGHASLMQHIQLAGIAAHAQGGEARKGFWKAMQRDLVLARAPDGSFQPRPWHESLAMGSNSDVSVGVVWTTASWTCVLVAEIGKDGKGGFPALFGR